VKEFLSRSGAAFTILDVDEDARAYDALVVKGFRTVPITIVGDYVVKGYDPDALQRALDSL
jgi:hypothetical protein